MAIIIPFKKSQAAAKAELKAKIAKAEKTHEKQAASPLKDRVHIKGFWAQYPHAKSIFGTILVVWRGSTSHRHGFSGFWAAYPHIWWAENMKTSVATLKRHLDLLEEYGLIERTLGHHGGARPLSFIRPTALALSLSNCRPTDWDHLGASPHDPIGKPKAPKPKPVQLIAQAGPEPGEDAPQTYEELMAIIGDGETPKSDLD